MFLGQVVSLSDDRVKTQLAGSNHVLIISRLRPDDTGSYMCYATNDLGSSQRITEITHEHILEEEEDNNRILDEDGGGESGAKRIQALEDRMRQEKADQLTNWLKIKVS